MGAYQRLMLSADLTSEAARERARKTAWPRSPARAIPDLPASAVARFERKTDKSGGPEACWVFIARYPDHYGSFSYRHLKYAAHRVAWVLAHGGQIPDRMEICHRCDNKRCVNPAHLFLGTRSDNIRDAFSKGIMKSNFAQAPQNKPRSHCKRGHALSDDNVIIQTGGSRRCKTCNHARNVSRRRRP